MERTLATQRVCLALRVLVDIRRVRYDFVEPMPGKRSAPSCSLRRGVAIGLHAGSNAVRSHCIRSIALRCLFAESRGLHG
jgi:hypothetical protein